MKAREKTRIIRSNRFGRNFEQEMRTAVMGTLRKVKSKMRRDKDLRKTLVRSGKDEILIDVDGDHEADVALLDTAGNGDIDTLAVDLTGDGEFNLYFTDTDRNGVPDVVLLDETGRGDFTLLGIGSEMEDAIVAAANRVLLMMEAEDYIAQALDEALDDLDKDIRAARKALKKRK